VSPGGTNERVAIYCASVDSADMGGIHGLEEEHEDIRVITLPFSEALKALESGVINNAATIIALQWLTIHQKEVFQR
jgi:ADP-ribose pyrophosphatase